MPKAEQVTPFALRQQKVLEVLEGGVRDWNELRALAKLSDESLGFILSELLDMRKIWTRQGGEMRIYGIERRTGLVPRFSHPLRRESDLRA